MEEFKLSSLAIASRSFSKNTLLREAVLKEYPDAKFNDKGLSLSGDSLIDFLDGYEKAITALEVIDDSILSSLPNLKVIGKQNFSIFFFLLLCQWQHRLVAVEHLMANARLILLHRAHKVLTNGFAVSHIHKLVRHRQRDGHIGDDPDAV